MGGVDDARRPGEALPFVSAEGNTLVRADASRAVSGTELLELEALAATSMLAPSEARGGSEPEREPTV
jgi:hypothetical protein